MKKTINILLVALSLCVTGVSEAKTIRASQMSSSVLSELKLYGTEALVVEFREGDRLPVHLSIKGDFLEASHESVTYVNVKRNFWLKIQNQYIQVSTDGLIYKPLKEVVSGALSVGSESENDGIANIINIVLEAYLK